MKLIDLHCDSLYKSETQNILLDDSSMQAKPMREGFACCKLQCYAVWLSDDIRGEKAERLFYNAQRKLISEAKRLNIKLIGKNDNFRNLFLNNTNSAFLTLENGSALNGKIDNINKFAQLGVKIITLTWNGSNELGDGAMVHNPAGLTKFGREAVFQMEKEGIIVDISHASDKLFYEVAEICSKPIIATHSDSRAVTHHPRNLADEQINVIIHKGGLIGLNFHNAFLNNEPQKACKFDILKHTEHFLSLGAQDNLCFGSDFDGCTLPKDIKGSESMADIYEMFLKHNYKESIIKKIFYENAQNFFENFDNHKIM